ncbi:hypothetical protein ACOCG7_24735 [Paraburkholderia sp. DD10]|jgi:hypothetical protein|uniref:4-amino-4-deoxy-L-arabinose transferase-like glycosyltransferase n=1 Tax=Paraburkholderia terricola TaxID=169427 RepID=A0ABU1LVU2_9BURK|nr:hypothetical protein [Paraburkholderia terricola]AXE93024.1 hypothetical protein CUJ90_12265 [Paraburkholderia terricola]MDR6410630.1 4-amino-4-deoxy-L-arabinose transferase-like glycosyltransferase [Paraburkholderia terricola]MDR6447327.1 4-amino-4-deoxy-L-arabinose transferase-like glycosyltransferase [Paraburkholderia terricola]MDR6480945.1 4-amino-4-deoxy-L-arabinose transferase-like glycosyltransferase [Paraburkholderia terricola]
MKWAIAFLALLASAIVVVLVARLPAEQAIRFAGYAGTALLAALVSLLFRWRAAKREQRKAPR